MRNHKLANTLLSFNIYLDGVDFFYQTGPYGHLTNLIKREQATIGPWPN